MLDEGRAADAFGASGLVDLPQHSAIKHDVDALLERSNVIELNRGRHRAYADNAIDNAVSDFCKKIRVFVDFAGASRGRHGFTIRSQSSDMAGKSFARLGKRFLKGATRGNTAR